MDLAIAIGLWGWALVAVIAVVIGVVAQFLGEAHTGYEWVAASIGAAIGAVVASEFIVTLRTFEPVFDGVALVPAIAGALVVGTLVAIATRYLTADRRTHRTVAI